MASQGQRRDSKHRILHTGESIRANGKYQYKYMVNGKPKFIYSWRLVPSDPQPVGKQPCLSLRELEKMVGQDLDSKLDPMGKKMTVKLQGIHGQQPAKAVKELKTGDVIVWNFGYTSTVVELIPSKTGKTITCMLKSNQDGIIRERKMSAERLVAIA